MAVEKNRQLLTEEKMESLKKNASQDVKINLMMDQINEIHRVLYENGFINEVTRNTIRCKAATWFIGAVVAAGISVLIAL